MGKNRSASGITNVIQYDNNGNIAFVSGSTTLMQVSSSGAITTTGVISGSNALSASFSLNSALLNDTGSVGFATTGSLLTVSSSQQQISASLLQVSASYISLSGSYNTFSGSNSEILTVVSSSNQQLSASYIALSGSYNMFSGSASTRITDNSSSIQQVSASQQQISASLLNVISIFATTGSNSFRATQSITGSLTVTGQIIAQTLNVQQVTSSIIYSSGSNNFGCDLNSRQTFTGSVLITGSFTLAGAITATQSTNDEQALSVINTNNGTSAAAVFNLQNDTNSSQIVYTSSTYTGVYGCGANAINIINRNSGPINFLTAGYSNAAIRMAITNCGIVGIGYISPVADDGNLVVAGAIGTGQGAANTVAQINIWETTSGNKSGLWFGSMTNANTGVIGSRTATGNIAFQTYCGGWAERMRISYNGNVGIGTTTPNSVLDIKTSSTGNQKLFSVGEPGYESSNYGLVLRGNDATGVFSFFGVNACAQTTNPVLSMNRSSGNVGIGAAFPVSKLHTCTAYGSNNIQAVFGNSNGSINCQVYDTVVIQQDDVPTLKLVERNIGSVDQVLTITTGDNSSRISTTCANSLQFFVGGNPSACGYNGLSGAAALTITCGGNVGIGNTPSYKLDVYRGSSGVVLNLQGVDAYDAETGILFTSSRAKISGFLNSGGGTPGSSLRFYTMPDGGSVTERMRIDSNGVTCFGARICATSATITTVNATTLTIGNIGHYQNYLNTSGCFAIFCASQGAILYVTSMHNNGRSTAIVNYANGVTGGASYSVVNQITPYGPAALGFGVCANGWLYGYAQYGGPMDFYAISIGSTFVWNF